MHITSRYKGVVIHLYHDIGDTAYVGDPLVLIETDGSAATNEEHSGQWIFLEKCCQSWVLTT